MVFHTTSRNPENYRKCERKWFDPIIIVELPDSCVYWDSDSLNQFTDAFGMRSEVCHGCAYGLTAQFGKDLGSPIKKPWRIAANSPVFLGHFPRKCWCPPNTKHIPCAGRETQLTENYPPLFASVFHDLFCYIVENNITTKRYDNQHYEWHPVAIAVEIDCCNHENDCCRVRPSCTDCHDHLNCNNCHDELNSHSMTFSTQRKSKGRKAAAAAASKTQEECKKGRESGREIQPAELPSHHD